MLAVWPRRWAAGWAAAALCAGLAVSACGGGDAHQPGRPTGASSTLDIYSSLPLRGPAAPRAVLVERGIKLALAQMHGRAGQWTIRYIPLDDSTRAANQWAPLRTASNASRAIADPRAVLYIGDFGSDASKVSIPIVNQGLIAQVSPASGYVGLTTDQPGSAPHEPDDYYPTGKQTFMRILPNDAVQAAADLNALRLSACATTRSADVGGDDGSALSTQIMLQKATLGVSLAPAAAFRRSAPLDFELALRRAQPACVLLTGGASAHAVQFAEAVHTALPNAKIFGGQGFCTTSFTAPIEALVRGKFYCVAPLPELTATSAGRRFLASYRAAYGASAPDPYVAYGYEAMKLGLDTIARLGPHGNSKQAVLAALLATTARQSVLGTYGFDRNGDTTLRSYGLYRPGPRGALTFVRTIIARS